MRKYKYETIDWSIIQKDYNEHKDMYFKNLIQKYHISRTCLNSAIKNNLFKVDESRRFHLHTEETKKKLSEKMKNYLKNNPDKHPWKKLSKFKSKPCERLKQILKEQNLEFFEEYSDGSWDYNYSLDIAFPNKKIAIEVNGNQHYNNNGTLKEYYVNRENYLKSLNWKVYQLHYSLIFDKDIIFNLIEKIKKDINDESINYSFYIKEKKKQNSLSDFKIKRQKFIEERKQLVLNSGIDFSKLGWVKKVSKLFGNKRSGGNWIKKFMPTFYQNKCFHRKTK